MTATPGAVYLVGAGPGDPGLLTLRGKQLLERADVVIYDYLAEEALLDHAANATLIPARDLHGNRSEQDRLNELMIEHARQGKAVVRLKGGDPYLFGRGGEEGQALKAAGIPFEVVPGVTSALAVPAYAGIPVTHRDHASAVAIFTGQVQDGKDVDWQQVGGHGTLVFLMAMSNLAEVVRQLVAHGRSPETPAAAIQWGTRPEQLTVSAKLRDLPTAVRAAELKSPAVVVIGDVVGLRDELCWFEKLPLFGVSVLVTRTRRQSSGFAESLREAGALVYQAPVIEICEPISWAAADQAIARLPGYYDWLVFTSANGVERFCQRLRQAGKDARALAGAQLCAIGSETAKALTRFGLQADLVPDQYVAEAVADALAARNPQRVLIPRAAVARDVLPDRLRAQGAQVDVVEVYRTEAPEGAADRLRQLIVGGRVNVVTFTSSSTVTNFLKLAGELPPNVKVACIGPITRRTAEEHGLKVDVEAATYTTAGLKDALIRYFATN